MAWNYYLLHNFPQFIVIHTVKGFGIINKAEIDVFLKFSCFLHDRANVGNLISGSSAFSKPSLKIWKFPVYILLKPGENFEYYFASLLDECRCLPPNKCVEKKKSLTTSDAFPCSRLHNLPEHL